MMPGELIAALVIVFVYGVFNNRRRNRPAVWRWYRTRRAQRSAARALAALEARANSHTQPGQHNGKTNRDG